MFLSLHLLCCKKNETCLLVNSQPRGAMPDTARWTNIYWKRRLWVLFFTLRGQRSNCKHCKTLLDLQFSASVGVCAGCDAVLEAGARKERPEITSTSCPLKERWSLGWPAYIFIYYSSILFYFSFFFLFRRFYEGLSIKKEWFIIIIIIFNQGQLFASTWNPHQS